MELAAARYSVVSGRLFRTSCTNYQPNLPRDEERDLTQDGCSNSKQVINADPYRDPYDGEDCACIHPVSGKDHDGSEDKPGNAGVGRKFSKRTINVTEYRNSNDKMNPAKYRTLGSGTNHLIPFH